MPPARVGRARRRIGPGTGLAVALLACALALGVRASGPGTGEGHGRTAPEEPAYVRSSGDVRGNGSAARIVSLHPAATEILIRLGAGARIVGRASDDRAVPTASLPSVGPMLRPSPERLRALDPTLVVVSRGWAPAGVDLLEEAGATIVRLPLERFHDVPRAVHLLGRHLGLDAEADRLVGRLEAEVGTLASWPEACPVPSVLWVVSATPMVVAGPGTLPDDLISVVGARNAFADAAVAWPRPSLEALAIGSVDVIVWPVGPELGPPERSPPDAPWRRLRAARSGGLVRVDADLVHRAGPRVGQAARRLRKRLLSLCPAHPSEPEDESP